MRLHTVQQFSCVLVLAAAPSTIVAQIRSCPAASLKARQVRAYVADYVPSPSHSSVRSRFGITTGDTSNLSIVTAESVCEAVTAKLDSLTGTTRSRAVIVIAFQTFFVGVDADGELIDEMYLLDSGYRPKAVIVSQD